MGGSYSIQRHTLSVLWISATFPVGPFLWLRRALDTEYMDSSFRSLCQQYLCRRVGFLLCFPEQELYRTDENRFLSIIYVYWQLVAEHGHGIFILSIRC